MGDKLTIQIDSFFYTHPVFRVEEFIAWKKDQGAATSKASQKALQYYVQKGRLINVRRGLYVVVPPNESSQTISVDPYLLAAKAAPDSILAYHTALELHGVAYSVFERFTFLTRQKNKPFEFQNRWFQPTALPSSLKKSEQDFGVMEINRQGIMIKITNLERTFVDVLDRVSLSGEWEEVIRSISAMAALNINTVVRYCLMLKNRILTAKVGFFLEKRQGAFAVNDETLKPLLKMKPALPQRITLNSKEPFQLVKKWNLLVPINILNKSWEEPNHDI